ncbi:hypothetical protein PsorP6_011750 [Peronosclerospora sorghi]|uniref:Uncharacterized protein n=1 Tax=Peronosclerospora sorghi TaxID=230839 RepID=A0ACC0WJ98_9STRA|nr:hypothetical protein PsorP6_011750 [Peronosclerospora sorghi]
MGRKPSNVYDYFIRLEPDAGQKGLVRFQCKKCDKQYASNATRLAEHLKLSCVPGFQTNQRTRKAHGSLVNIHPHREIPEHEETESSDGITTSVLSLGIPPPDTSYTSAGAETTQALVLKRSDHQLLATMLESEHEPPQDTTEVLLRLAKLSTCVIGDAMTQMKVQGHLVDVNLIRGYDAPLAMNICGPALTVKMMPSTGVLRNAKSCNYIETAEMGQVVVISAPMTSTAAVFDSLMATASKMRNVAGIVTDGRVRDVHKVCSMMFPTFATGTSIHGGMETMTVVEVNCPILVAGCVVRQNDIIRGDINGVIVIPAERAQDIATRAEIIEDQDNKIIHALNQGGSLQKSLHHFRASRDV